MASPTERTLKMLRELGYLALHVEHWNAYTRRRHDLWGFDHLALHPTQPGVLGVQSTSGSCHSARRQKLRGLAPVALWLATGNRVWIVSWQKRGPRGKRKLWAPRIEALTPEDVAEKETGT